MLRLAALVFTCALAGCGLHPLYGGANGYQTQAKLSGVHVAPIANRSGQILRNYLIDALGSEGEGPQLYTLTVTLTESRQNLAYLNDATTSYARLVESAEFTLSDFRTGKPLSTGKVQSSNSYDALGTGYTTLTAEEDARDRALQQLSEALIARLALGAGRG